MKFVTRFGSLQIHQKSDPNEPSFLYLTENQINFELLNCVFLKKFPNGNVTCFKCDSFSYLFEGRCIKNDVNCAISNSLNKCVQCKPNYVLNNKFQCIFSEICEIGNTKTCFKCQQGYFNVNGTCKITTNCLLTDGTVCRKCRKGLSMGTCDNCDLNCNKCDFVSKKCLVCEEGTMLTEKGSCISQEGAITYGMSTLFCLNTFYINNSICLKCNQKNENWVICTNSMPTKCSPKFLLSSEGNCVTSSCEQNEIKEANGKCTIPISNCESVLNSKCVLCKEEYIKNSKNECQHFTTILEVDYCDIRNSSGCISCQFGYYLSDEKCLKCDDNCESCLFNSTSCLSCYSGFYKQEKTCISNSELTESCQHLSTVISGCTQCKDGYYRIGLGCAKCDKKCSLCNTKAKCLSCNSTNFKTSSGECLPQDLISGCDIEITQSGCSKCQNGYYQFDTNQCEKCSNKCLTCSSRESCLTCKNGDVLVGSNCILFSSIKSCTASSNSKCTKCSFWNTPSEAGTFCENKAVWWIILLIVVFIVLVLLSTSGLIVYFTKLILNKMHQKIQHERVTIFKMKRSNIQFISLGNSICSNHRIVDFNSETDEIPVLKETRQLLCIGNTKERTLKVQISMKSDQESYSIRTTPEIISLKRGFACEFEIFIRPNYTCKITDDALIISKSLESGKEFISKITIEGKH
ncbi:hypothetical protein EIN_020220 [Entamoeba invadens IP1]|uniref:hypothetical protein n=1 Tax=Entamoeba invadens IP1 TaxID=370355 RepID=UPI0002C3DECB|nr:hypothetical protein EIN_020220 [Entamoeba invadens IP1]ELP90573.1 hypothetical protein EIN_020220 [Entamoeba invadens IP1]|eukprot:XP_004257344.1 hypothetical protein EIN_020220 [Entamoeba invadens IP1]